MTTQGVTFTQYFGQKRSDVWDIDTDDELTIYGMLGNEIPVGHRLIFILGNKSVTGEVLETQPYDGPREVADREGLGEMWQAIFDPVRPMFTHRLRVLSFSDGKYAKSVEPAQGVRDGLSPSVG
jgi:hypothetical protein